MPNTCPICGGELGRNKKACSHACYSILLSHTKICVICGAEFLTPPSSEKITCSRACSIENRKNKHDLGFYDDSLEKMHEGAKTSPLTGRFETHMHAKQWTIQSPDGQIYTCRNLLKWLRDHANLLDGTPRQAFDGISKIKYSIQGKRKNPSKYWKGWSLLDYSE